MASVLQFIVFFLWACRACLGAVSGKREVRKKALYL